MDLKLSDATASEVESAAVASVARPRRRDLLLPTLHAVNDAVGWISPGAINAISSALDVAPADVYGVASFYDHFSFEPQPVHRTLACSDLACRVAAGCGAGPLPLPPGTEPSPCLGLCDQAPATLTLGQPATGPGPTSGDAPVTATVAPALPVLLRRVGRVDPTSLDDYRAHGGFAGLNAALLHGADWVLSQLEASGLVGRGGAAFPAGRKWAAVAAQPAGRGPKQLICNADESEPGTFKDRVLLEGDPFAVIEALAIAGYTVGAPLGRIYLRAEYPTALSRLQAAIDAARAAGLLGPDVGGSGFAFDIEIRRGAGAYICGEETAIFNSIEGHRGEPRSKPPFPVESGLFGRPTLVNNVETLVNVPPLLVAGGSAYGPGPKLFAVSGSVARPGVYEAPLGTPLGSLLEAAGGVRGNLQAVLLGGAAGAFVGPDRLDLPLSFDAARAAGVTLGSGVVMVLNDTVDLNAFLLRVAEFFRHESCGQCVPCRIGTVRQQEVVVRLAGGRPRSTDLALLADLDAAMTDASICGLGQTAASAIRSAIANLGAFS